MTTVHDTKIHTDQKRADEMAAGLRRLADMIVAQPEMASVLAFSLGNIGEPLSTEKNPRAALASVARAGKAAGAQVAKHFSDTHGNIHVDFGGGVKLHAWVERAQVCEKVITGTREIVEQVPDPEALAAVPTIEQTRVEDIVEWVCRPLLADDGDQAPAGDEAAAVTR